MSYRPGNRPTESRSNGVAAGLEIEFDNLMLNSSGEPSAQSRTSPWPQHAAAAASSGPMFVAPPGFGPIQSAAAPIQNAAAPIQNAAVHYGNADHFQQKPPTRKRPNQAQRRQMSSQLSVDVDTRISNPSYNWQALNHGPNRAGPSAPFPRHQYTMSHPHTDHSRSRQQQDHVSWTNGLGVPRNSNLVPQSGPGHPGYLPQHQNSQFENRPRHNPGIHGNRHGRPQVTREEIISQSTLLDNLCSKTLASSEIARSDIAEKETFRHRIEGICRQVITEHEWNTNENPDFPPPSVELRCFGSLASGFATKASDMDLGLLSPLSDLQPDAPGSPIPRLIEKAFLDVGIGARLLSRTRVPIIKLCESPPEPLLKDLLANRAKWEAGMDQDHNESQDEDEHVADKSNCVKIEESTPQSEQGNNAVDFSTFQVLDEDGQLHDFHIRQTSKHNLTSYYGLAKRVLRKAGGRDVTLSNWREFTHHDWNVLNLVCRAFVHGLADAMLRQSLIKYPSLAFKLDSGTPHNRSLLGVSTQVEGEEIIQMWQNWPISTVLARLDPLHGPCIDFWYRLQAEENFGQDPLRYTKELQIALEKLKKLPSFQLLLFEQSQQESVTQYLERMLTITKHLQISGHLDGSSQVQREVIDKYIAGICYEDVRNDVKSWQSSTGTLDLGVVSSKHRCLQLAADLERALNKRIYDGAVAEDVSRGIEILRGPLREPVGQRGPLALVVPIANDEVDALFRRLESIPDPQTVAPNQPHDRYHDPLEFPERGAGVQCDLNFSAHLALENTLLLRCYSHTDMRVRPMVLFIKHWAKVRGINSGYRGTLSSYGYVLMVLHYLVNVASPYVCPNLQLIPISETDDPQICKGYNVRFWRNEIAIMRLAGSNGINQNSQTIGYLLRGFFEYFAQGGTLSTRPMRGFDWGREVLSLRSSGGLLSKQEKGWTGAKTVYQAQDPNEPSVKPPTNTTEGTLSSTPPDEARTTPKSAVPVKEVRLRYLFAIEDPFEIEHNVARTVTHNGIVSIRDEFRRAWRIIQAAGQGMPHDDLLEDVTQEGVNFKRSLREVCGWEMER
ncbi:Poly(A) RNA polymerase cid13 [Cordyceps militaris CM01]|uniref:polynucleotide adenylyltransferase n=1 Tax=Cordyceps militaris (strain CM01) TaxID=983644 RepID=G3J403_CORMM|nr:Poly(A) RNA polymerase cid13 [Cordyceps militaris CM01]EGX95778.1 Poly(A) RNA polymerase cid13 [Cordyceps militaris CM01]